MSSYKGSLNIHYLKMSSLLNRLSSYKGSFNKLIACLRSARVELRTRGEWWTAGGEPEIQTSRDYNFLPLSK